MADNSWYYDPTDGTVAQGMQDSWSNRMGPYASKEEAEHAMKIARQRTEEADAADQAEREEDDNWGAAPSWEK